MSEAEHTYQGNIGVKKGKPGSEECLGKFQPI